MKSVKFNTNVSVILVPSVNEYNKISMDIWWSNEDFKRFRIECYRELLNEINFSRNKFEIELKNKNLELNVDNFFKLAQANIYQCVD
jgi:hypothetical protein